MQAQAAAGLDDGMRHRGPIQPGDSILAAVRSLVYRRGDLAGLMGMADLVESGWLASCCGARQPGAQPWRRQPLLTMAGQRSGKG